MKKDYNLLKIQKIDKNRLTFNATSHIINLKVNKSGVNYMFIGREKELADLNYLYEQNSFQMFILYGRRRVGKTTLLGEFCKGKDTIFFAAEQDSDKGNLDKFSSLIFAHYNETILSPFSDWENAITFIAEKQREKRLILVFDEFPYLAKNNKKIFSVLQHLIDHKLQKGKLFIILCGSYMSFMEKEVLGEKSPIFGRRTAQLKLKPFPYYVAAEFVADCSAETKCEYYGAVGGTAQYLGRLKPSISFEKNICNLFLNPTGYLYEEPRLLLRQEIQEPAIYNAIIEAIACGASKSNEIATKTGEEQAKCLKYIQTLCELGLVYKETPFGEKESSRKTIYGISDFMFRFWYKYVFNNRSLLETGGGQIVYEKKIKPDYNHYMGLVFERICKEFLEKKNIGGELPILFSSIGRWWGTDSVQKQEVEIDIIARDDKKYLIGECKWQNEKMDIGVLERLKEKANIFNNKREETWYTLFSKSGFTKSLLETSENDRHILLFDLKNM